MRSTVVRVSRHAATLPRRVSAVRHASTLPRIVEPHFHYNFPSEPFHGTLKDFGIEDYTAEQFVADAAGLPIDKAVHMEIIPTSPLGEAEYVERLIAEKRTPAAGIVAACDLSADDADAQLRTLKARVPHLVGIRYMVDYDGPFGEAPATHVAVSRHGADGAPAKAGAGAGVDFLRDAAVAPKFEAGYARLAEHGLRFDLQCAPAQLEAAAALIGRHPGVPVVVDHLGKPRLSDDATLVLTDDAATDVRVQAASDAAELATWRRGMKAVAAHEHACVKLSMLGYAVPGWAKDAAKEALVESLVHEASPPHTSRPARRVGPPARSLAAARR